MSWLSTITEIILWWCVLAFALTGFCALARGPRWRDRSRIITETPVDVLFVANDHEGSRSWA